jgi:hypothetical protein
MCLLNCFCRFLPSRWVAGNILGPTSFIHPAQEETGRHAVGEKPKSFIYQLDQIFYTQANFKTSSILDIALANTWPNPLRQSDSFSATLQNHSLAVALEGAFPQLVDLEC